MALPALTQLCQSGWFVLLGAGLGLLYDILGGARDRLKLPAWAADGIFAFGVIAALFVGGMATLEGRPRLYMALVMLSGLALWRAGASPVTRPALGRLWAMGARGAARLAAPVRRGADFLWKYAKKLFSNGRKGFTIIVTHWKQTLRDRKGERRRETSPRPLR